MAALLPSSSSLTTNGTLQDLMEQCERSGHPLPEGKVIQLMVSLCRALHAMHTTSHPMAHRDVKPANLLLADSMDELVLMDLGSAAPASITVTNRQEALALQEVCAQTCTAQYRSVQSPLLLVLLIPLDLQSPRAV
jgi:serine/threonine kinase 16